MSKSLSIKHLEQNRCMQKIKELIKPQLDDLFVDIHKMVKKSLDRQPSPPEVLTKEMQQKL